MTAVCWNVSLCLFQAQYDQDISSMKQMLLVREREVAHLEGLLVRLQEQSPSGSNVKAYKSQIKSLKQEIQVCTLNVLQL